MGESHPHHDDRGWVLHAVSWPLLGTCAIVTALRFWVRIRIIRSLGWDDAFIVLALVCAIINTALVIVSVQNGSGRHTDVLSDHHVRMAAKYQILSQGFHVMSTNFGKVSVAMFLIRIISGVKNHKRGMYALIVIMSLINIGCVVTIYGQCTPTRFMWDRGVEGSCWPPGAQQKYAYFQGSTSAFTDLILAIYPLFTIQQLQMATRVKLGLGFVLSLGIIAMIAAIIKTTRLFELTAYDDYTWDTVDLTIWVAVEQYLIILAACIPALTPLFNIIVRHRSSKRSKSTANELHAVSTYTRSGTRTWKQKSAARSGGAGGAVSVSGHQSYNPFASVGREFVEYPLTWTQSKPGLQSQHSLSGSDSEAPIVQPETPRGILRTTEFRINEVPAGQYEGVG
ncbi:hypothetical protein BDW62DRAFT_213546 [Aspergillus aurantiobrunneus]